MEFRANQTLAFLLCLLLCLGTFAKESRKGPTPTQSTQKKQISNEAQISGKLYVKVENKYKQVLLSTTEIESSSKMSENVKDVITPITTIPVINPSDPTTTTPVYNPFPTPSNPTTPVFTPVTTPTYSTPTMVTPSATGRSWCVASQTASQTVLQVALDYACGYGGADCSAIQQDGNCFNPDTVHNHASYAFNEYYQKNPIATSCNFGGAAVITNVDPSTSTCQHPSTSTSSSILNTTYPTRSTVFGLVPPEYSVSTSIMSSMTHFITLIYLLLSMILLNVHK